MKIASIDIGSNTVILLIIEIKNRVIISEKNFFRIGKLGKNLTAGNKIKKEKIQLLLRILEDYFKIINDNNCNTIIITATNALRIAANGKEITAIIFEKFGTRVNIISGKLEAKYSFLGASFNYSKTKKNNLVIDIGGGSTEIIIGSQKKFLFRKSFQIGTVSLTDKFIINSKPDIDKILQMELFIRKVFLEIRNYHSTELTAIGVGGTPTSLSGMIQNIRVYGEDKLEGSFIYYKELSRLSNTLSKLSAFEILKKYGKIVEGRNDVIFSGSIILKILFEIFNINRIIVSGKGLRYGVVYSKYLL